MGEPSVTQICTKFLKQVREKGKSVTDFRVSISKLQEVASTQGLDTRTIKMIIDILKFMDLGSNNCILLIKCMIPKGKINDAEIQKLMTWFLKQSAPVTTLNTLLQWFIGCWEYQLINKNAIYIFYDPLFLTMLRQERLESRLAQLIYLISKPEDVTRRQVLRLLALNEKSGKSPKHIIALLSLFKSYKPEFVPEKIQAINIQSIWRPITEVLQIGFKDASDRINMGQNHNEFSYNQKMFHQTKVKKNEEPLIPSIGYFHIGSSIFNDRAEKLIFDVSNYTQFGKYQSIIKLPCTATSLLNNSIGYHLLTYADFEYQQRFMYNLYYTLWRSFIFENGRYSNEEMNNILDMTMEFSRYMQHGISIVNYFINEYLSCYMDEHHIKLLSLMQWSTISTSELQDYVLKHMKLMFYSSSLNTKFEIIRTLKALSVNLSVINNEAFADKTFPFLGQSHCGKLTENIQIINKFSKELITSALNIHFYNSNLISESLSYYEQINVLEIYNNRNLFTPAPMCVVYGCFITKSCALLSRLCSLLLKHRKCLKDRKADFRSIKLLIVYAEDLVSALWYDNCISNRMGNDRYFLKDLSDAAIKNCQLHDMNSLLNIYEHCAVLPFVYTLNGTGLQIKSKEDANILAAEYCPSVNQFINALLGKLN